MTLTLRSALRALLAGAALTVLTGCTALNHYASDRWHDLEDIPIIGGGLGGLVIFGPGGGLEAEIKATELFIPAIGASEMREFEFVHGECTRFDDRRLSFPFAPIYSLLTGATPFPPVAYRSAPYAGYFVMNLRQYYSDFTLRYRQATAYSLPSGMSDASAGVLGNRGLEGFNHWWLITPCLDSAQPLINHFDVHAEVTFLFVSAKLGASPGQLLDFLLGIVGFDIGKDDMYPPFGGVLSRSNRFMAPTDQSGQMANQGEDMGTSTTRPRPGETALIEELEIVYFDYDRSDLDALDRAALDRDVEWLRAHPDMPVLIEGHCDERGTDEYNYALGERRANVVLSYLRQAGVTNELATRSAGESEPVCSDHSEDCWQLNRRAQFMRYLE